MKKVGLIILSPVLAGLILLGIQFGMASANQAEGKVADFSPDLSCNVPGSYSTIQSAINDISCDEVVIAAGSYSESLVITRSVTIRE